MTLVEVLATLAIGTIVLSSMYLAMGTAVRSRVKVGLTIHNQQHGRLAIQWMSDRLRQAGYGVDTASPLPRCRDALVVEDAGLQPTATRIFFNTDLDGPGALPTQTIGFYQGTEFVAGAAVPVLLQSVADCTTGAGTTAGSLMDPSSVRVLSLQFQYYDAAGAVVTDLTSPAGIRSIRRVRITLQMRAAGPRDVEDQTWQTTVTLRNPEPHTL